MPTWCWCRCRRGWCSEPGGLNSTRHRRQYSTCRRWRSPRAGRRRERRDWFAGVHGVGRGVRGGPTS